MPANVRWDDNDDSIIIREMIGNWTWDEYFGAIKEVHELMSAVNHRVDIIVDCREMGRFPDTALLNIKNANKSYNENIGIQVIVASDRTVEVFAGMLQKMMPQAIDRFLFVNEIEDAYTKIQDARKGSDALTDV